ncbi:phosphoheptose isomerase [Candidatus Saccharibacteria bacterium]|nr:phosphoheptose isomerase [Candidatus Saccharibacteria bacterium]
MGEFSDAIKHVNIQSTRANHYIFNDIVKIAQNFGYVIDDVDLNKPWGFFVRFESTGAQQFIENFFPGLSYEDACLGNPDAQLSPKFLLVNPEGLLSWQYHERRAERWAYLTDGSYYKSMTDEKGEPHKAKAGDVVQFECGERHRLVGLDDEYVLVAEVWQHADKHNLSDESDIIRLEDIYKR